jgi:hypothetical protein
MPELPEVETTVRGLRLRVLNRTFIDVWADFPKMIKKPDDFEKFKKEIKGRKIEDIKRRAKNILIELSGGKVLLIHQKLTGHLLVGKWKRISNEWRPAEKGPLSDKINSFIHLIFWLDDNMLALSDLRKFAKVELWSRKELENSEEFKKFETILGLMKIKLRHKHGITESKNYIISENQLKFIVENSKMDTMVSQYLNSQDWRTWDIGDGEFNVADGEFGKDLIRFRIQSSSTVPDHEFNVIYLEDGLVTKINNLFGLGSENSIISIINWFNGKYDKNLTRDDFEWLDSDTYYAEDEEYYDN